MLICFRILSTDHQILNSIVVSIPACHAGDQGSIPHRGEFFSFSVHSFLLWWSRRTKHQLVSFFQNYEIICKVATVIHSLTQGRYVVHDSKLPFFIVLRFSTISLYRHMREENITATPYNQSSCTQATKNT